MCCCSTSRSRTRCADAALLQDELFADLGPGSPPVQRRTVVFITHAIDERCLADRVAVMTTHPGRLRHCSTSTCRVRVTMRPRAAEFQALSSTSWSLIRDEAYRRETVT